MVCAMTRNNNLTVHVAGLGQDHPACLSAFYLKESAGAISVTDELLHTNGRIRTRAILKYLLFKKGPLATTGCDHGAFVSTAGAQNSSYDIIVQFISQLYTLRWKTLGS